MNEIQQAREWAESVDKIEGLHPEPRAAAEVIQSLPDQWVDAEKVREVIEEARLLIHDGEPEIILNDLAALLPAPRPRTLPDTVVDGDKLREVINKVLANTVHGTVGHQVAEDYAALIGELIPAPSLPTLADMTPEERDAQKWMQAQVFPTASTLGIITDVDEYERSAIILFADGMAKNVPWEEIPHSLTSRSWNGLVLPWTGQVIDGE